MQDFKVKMKKGGWCEPIAFLSVFCYFLVSVAASENAEQIKEEVDEIEIQGECTE